MTGVPALRTRSSSSSGAAHLIARLRSTPAFHLSDQVLSSGTNFLAVVVVARIATPRQFGMFSLFLITYYVSTGFNRSVPHAIAMTMDWDDERSRNGYFFLPPLAVGLLTTCALAATFAVLDPSWMPLSLLLLPLLLQDAVRMHAFAIHKPQLALASDALWLVIECLGFVLVSTATGAAGVWGLGGLVGLLVTRPWRIRIRLERRPVKANVVSAALEYTTLTGLGYLTPVLASPIITLLGVGALQGANVIRGPIILLMQGLVVHRMSGPPITLETCMPEALRLSGIILGVTLLCSPPLYLFREFYGPALLGSTWPQVEPLIVPALLTLVLASATVGPLTMARKMGRFETSAKLQGSLSPTFVALPLVGASAWGINGFLYGLAGAYAVSGAAWWIILPKLGPRRVGMP